MNASTPKHARTAVEATHDERDERATTSYRVQNRRPIQFDRNISSSSAMRRICQNSHCCSLAFNLQSPASLKVNVTSNIVSPLSSNTTIACSRRLKTTAKEIPLASRTTLKVSPLSTIENS